MPLKNDKKMTRDRSWYKNFLEQERLLKREIINNNERRGQGGATYDALCAERMKNDILKHHWLKEVLCTTAFL